jgi:hypothetical protein
MFRRLTIRISLLVTASVAVIASAPSPARADETVTPSALVASPSSFEGKAVSVTGTVAKFQVKKTLMGTVAAYQLCDEKCVVVIDQTNVEHKDGDKVTAAGTFQTTFKGPARSFNNVIVIK